MSLISQTPQPPYYAVIFTSEHSEDSDGYAEMAARMQELARTQDGFIGMESVREGKQGITVSYWTSPEAIRKWKTNVEHLGAQARGRGVWYKRFRVRVAKVERES